MSNIKIINKKMKTVMSLYVIFKYIIFKKHNYDLISPDIIIIENILFQI